LTQIDRARPEYEQLLIKKKFRGDYNLILKKVFFMRFRRNPSGKIIFWGQFFLIAGIYFGIFFLHNKYYFGNLFLNHEKVSESR
jgi:hypothetical protein